LAIEASNSKPWLGNTYPIMYELNLAFLLFHHPLLDFGFKILLKNDEFV
jgi:hypothetical protein